MKTRLSKLTSIFDPILVPTWLHFGSKKLHNSSINRFQEASKKRSIFASIFYRFLIDFGDQLGAMLAAFSAQKGRLCGKLACFLLRCYFESIFFEMLKKGPMGYPSFGSQGPMGYPCFGAILNHFGFIFWAPPWGPSAPKDTKFLTLRVTPPAHPVQRFFVDLLLAQCRCQFGAILGHLGART